MSRFITRRTTLGAIMSFTSLSFGAVEAADPFSIAIRRAEAADTLYRESGRLAREIQAAGLSLPADWRTYRADLLQARTIARFELHALTPTTPEAAAALVSYYWTRAEACGDPVALRAAQRRLRKVFQRPGAFTLVALPQARASPD